MDSDDDSYYAESSSPRYDSDSSTGSAHGSGRSSPDDMLFRDEIDEQQPSHEDNRPHDLYYEEMSSPRYDSDSSIGPAHGSGCTCPDDMPFWDEDDEQSSSQNNSREYSSSQNNSSEYSSSQEDDKAQNSKPENNPDARQPFGEYTVTGRGTNDQGNRWDNRDYGPSAQSKNTYHYSNKDGGYYYKNPDGSRYYNNGKGAGYYTPPWKEEWKECQKK